MAISQLRLKQLKSLKRKFTSLSRLKRSSPLKYLSPDLYAVPNSVFSACLHAYEFCYLILIHHMERGTSDWPFCVVYSERHHRKLKFALESEKPRIRQWSLPVIFSWKTWSTKFAWKFCSSPIEIGKNPNDQTNLDHLILIKRKQLK